MEIKSKYFAGEESKSLEPKCGIVSVADGTAKGIGHLIAASVCHGGTVDCGLEEVLKDFPTDFISWVFIS